MGEYGRMFCKNSGLYASAGGGPGAIGTIVAGALLKFNALIYGGIICNIAAFASLLVGTEHWTLIALLAVTGSNLIPGYLMKAHYKKVNN